MPLIAAGGSCGQTGSPNTRQGAGSRSNFRSLGQGKRIVDIHTEISHSVFDVGVAKQYLDGAQIAGSLVNQGGLRSPE